MCQALDAVDTPSPPKADATTRGNLSLGSLPPVMRAFLATGNAHVVLGCQDEGCQTRAMVTFCPWNFSDELSLCSVHYRQEPLKALGVEEA